MQIDPSDDSVILKVDANEAFLCPSRRGDVKGVTTSRISTSYRPLPASCFQIFFKVVLGQYHVCAGEYRLWRKEGRLAERVSQLKLKPTCRASATTMAFI
jgi:hypothetical protein